MYISGRLVSVHRLFTPFFPHRENRGLSDFKPGNICDVIILSKSNFQCFFPCLLQCFWIQHSELISPCIKGELFIFRDCVQDISVLTHPIPVLSTQQGLLESIKIPPDHLSFFFTFSVFVSFHVLFFHKLLKMACGWLSSVAKSRLHDHKIWWLRLISYL